MRKLVKVVYTKNEGNLFKFIECAKIGVERKYPFASIVDIKASIILNAEFVNIFYTLEV